MTARFRATAFRASLALLLLVPLAAQAQRPRSSVEETVDTVVVEVPVYVVDGKGEPVRGLSRENFEIVDGRREQQIVGFDAIDLTTTETVTGEPAPAPATGRRHFLFLFDTAFSDPNLISQARDEAISVLETALHPSDLVAVATYTAASGPRMVLGFTPDRDQARVAIRTLGLSDMVERAPDPLQLILTQLESSDRGSLASSGGSGGRGPDRDAIFRENLQDMAARSGERQLAQGEVASMAKGLEDLARVLGSVEGRKLVVYFSEGFDSSLLSGTTDTKELQAMNRAAETGEYWKVDSDARYGSSSTVNLFEEMLEEFRRADASIYGVDVAGLRDSGSGHSTRDDSLFSMARATGGEAFSNFNDLGGAMEKVIERTAVTYVLAFQPQDLALDGSYHKLKVKLEGVPRDFRVVHRPGYYAPRPYETRSGVERQLEAAQAVVSGTEGGSVGLSVLAVPFREAGKDRAFVPVLIEIAGRDLLSAGVDGKAGLEVYVYAMNADGTVADYFAQTVGLDLAKVRPVLETSGIKLFGDVELPPGDYTLRTFVREARSGRSALRVNHVDVPEASTAHPSLAMPLIPEPPGKWLMIQEESGMEARRQRPYPFVRDGAPYVPAARPVLSRGSENPLDLVVYANGDPSGDVSAAFVGADGESHGSARIQVLGVEPMAGGGQRVRANLSAAGLEPGEYTLEVRIGGGEVLSSRVSVLVV